MHLLQPAQIFSRGLVWTDRRAGEYTSGFILLVGVKVDKEMLPSKSYIAYIVLGSHQHSPGKLPSDSNVIRFGMTTSIGR